jgi:hypothetical protein
LKKSGDEWYKSDNGLNFFALNYLGLDYGEIVEEMEDGGRKGLDILL